MAHSFCPATLNGVLGSCLQKSKFYRGVPELPGTPPPYAPAYQQDSLYAWIGMTALTVALVLPAARYAHLCYRCVHNPRVTDRNHKASQCTYRQQDRQNNN